MSWDMQHKVSLNHRPVQWEGSVDHADWLACTVGDLLGRAIALQVPADKPQQAPQKHDFAFDKVFAPAAGQVSAFKLTCLFTYVMQGITDYKVDVRGFLYMAQHTRQCMQTEVATVQALTLGGILPCFVLYH